MNLVARQIYGFKPLIITPTWNTYVGGVSATISTASLLATKLGISVGAISNFTIVGSDIKCKITGSYYAAVNAFNGDTNVTYYTDTDGLVSKCIRFANCTNFTGDIFFQNALSVEETYTCYKTKSRIINLPSVTSVVGDAFNSVAETNPLVRQFYLPNCVSYGASHSVNNGVFGGVLSGSRIYAHPSMATINSGGVEADLAAAISAGCILRYVSNLTAPNPITDLSSGTIYNNSMQVNFTAPTGNTNAIDYYECYVNGVFKQNIVSGGYIIGLLPSTSYSIEVKPVDIFFNKSTSNIVTQSTNTTSGLPPMGLISYYKLDEISGTIANDSYGTQHLTNTSVSINQSGKVGNAYASTAASQKLKSIAAPCNVGSFSINIWCYPTAAPTGTYSQLYGYGDYPNGYALWINTSREIGWRINTDYLNFSSLQVVPLNTWSMVTMVYDGKSLKIYVNGVEKTSKTTTNLPVATSTKMMYARTAEDGYFIGRLDEACDFNIALNQIQIDNLYNSGNGITL